MNEPNFLVVFNYRTANKLIERRYRLDHLDRNCKHPGVVFYFDYCPEAQKIVDEINELKDKLLNY